MGSREDFSQVARGHRDGKNTKSVHGTLNRYALLCSVMAKVELEEEFSEIHIQKAV